MRRAVVPERRCRIDVLLHRLSPTAQFKPETARDWVLANGNHVVVARDTEIRHGHIKGILVGMALLTFRRTFRGFVGEVDEVCVDAAYTGKGVGRALMQEVLAAARLRRLVHLDLTCRSSREEATALYESLGFKRRETVPYRLEF